MKSIPVRVWMGRHHLHLLAPIAFVLFVIKQKICQNVWTLHECLCWIYFINCISWCFFPMCSRPEVSLLCQSPKWVKADRTQYVWSSSSPITIVVMALSFPNHVWRKVNVYSAMFAFSVEFFRGLNWLNFHENVAPVRVWLGYRLYNSLCGICLPQEVSCFLWLNRKFVEIFGHNAVCARNIL